MTELVYFYPMYKTHSFTYVAKQHIAYLKQFYKIHEADEIVLDTMRWNSRKNIVLHPPLYFLAGHNWETYLQKKHRIKRLFENAKTLIGIEVADTDRISDLAVQILNRFDAIVVPSEFCRQVMFFSGVQTDVYVVPHGVNPAFLTEDTSIRSESMRKLLSLKEERDYIFVLFFLAHSGFRKGADLVYEAMKRIQAEYKNVILVVKRTDLIDPLLPPLRRLRMIELSGWFSDRELRELYDVCDIVLCPSRGGGFELNALEGIARGKPTIVTSAGCFMDYIQYTIPVKVKEKVKLFGDNIIHVGNGFTADIDDLTAKIAKVIDNLDKYKRKFEEYAKIVRKEYTWENTGKKLVNVIKHVLGDGYDTVYI